MLGSRTLLSEDFKIKTQVKSLKLMLFKVSLWQYLVHLLSLVCPNKLLWPRLFIDIYVTKKTKIAREKEENDGDRARAGEKNFLHHHQHRC